MSSVRYMHIVTNVLLINVFFTTLIKCEKLSSIPLSVLDGSVQKPLFDLKYGTETHVCKDYLSYILMNRTNCSFNPPLDEQSNFLKTVLINSVSLENVKSYWEQYLNSTIGQSVGEYLMNKTYKDFNSTDYRSLLEKIHRIWFLTTTRVKEHHTPFGKTFLGEVKTKGEGRYGFKSWHGYTVVRKVKNLDKNFTIGPYVNIAIFPYENANCGKIQVQHVALNYTYGDCNNQVRGSMTPGVSFYLDMSLFTVAAYIAEIRNVTQLEMITNMPDYPECPLRIRAVREESHNHHKVYLGHAEYLYN